MHIMTLNADTFLRNIYTIIDHLFSR